MLRVGKSPEMQNEKKDPVDKRKALKVRSRSASRVPGPGAPSWPGAAWGAAPQPPTAVSCERLQGSDGELEIVAQSPVALSPLTAQNWQPARTLSFNGHWLPGAKARVFNNSISALMMLAQGEPLPRLAGGPLHGDFIFEQLHFHWASDNHSGSEHSIDGHKYAGEAHLVHYNSKYSGFAEALLHGDGLAVTGFLLKAEQLPNKRFAKLAHAVEQVPLPDQETNIPSEECLPWMLDIPLDECYYTYRGSLTTAPYYESVTWIVYERPISISTCQMEPFRNMRSSASGDVISCNARALQPRPSGLRVRHAGQRAHRCPSTPRSQL